MCGVATAIVGTAIVSGVVQSNAADDAAKATRRASGAAIKSQEAAQAESRELAQPFIDIGLGAGDQLQKLMGDPLAGIEEINPVVSFLRDQGFQDIQESAAAKGRLGAGGTLQDLTEFNTNIAATVAPGLQQQKFNQLFNVLGLGQNAAAGQGTQALATGANVGNLQMASGQAQGNAAINRANAITNTLDQATGAFSATGGFKASTPPPATTALSQTPFTPIPQSTTLPTLAL